MSQQQISVAISDAILAAVAATCCVALSTVQFASHSFFFTAAAASLGAVRFALHSPPVALIAVHEVFAFAVPTIGFPLLAIGARALTASEPGWPISPTQTIALFDALMLAVWFLANRQLREIYRVSVSVIALLLVIAAIPGTKSAVALQIVAAAIGVAGSIRVTDTIRVLRVDAFHYLTALSQASFAVAILKSLRQE